MNPDQSFRPDPGRPAPEEDGRGEPEDWTSEPAPDVTTETLGVVMEELNVAEEELRQQNEELTRSRALIEAESRRYRELFDLAPDLYLVTDVAGMIREANLSAAEALNLDVRFLIGKPLVTFIPEEGRPAFRGNLVRISNALRHETPRLRLRLRLRLRPRKQVPFPAEATIAASRDWRGEVIALRWLIRDVTASEELEARLRRLNAELERRVLERTEQLESELRDRERLLIGAHLAYSEREAAGQRLLDLIEGLDAIIWKADAATGRLTFVSRPAEALLGYPADSWIEDPDFWARTIHPDDRDWATSRRRKAFLDGHDHELEYRLVAADGRILWFREGVRAVRDDSGLLREFRGLMVNITRRKKVERQLYAAKSELVSRLDDLEYLHELSSRLATLGDQRGRIEETLTAVTALLGTDLGTIALYDPARDELVRVATTGADWEIDEAARRVPRGQGACGRALETGSPVIMEDLGAPDAPTDPVSRDLVEAGARAVLSTPMVTRDGRFVGTIAAYFREPHRPGDRQVFLVQQYAALAAELIAHSQRAEAVGSRARKVDEVLAMLLADLRDPSGTIRGALRTRGADHADITHVLEAVGRQVQQLSRLVDDLLRPDDEGEAAPAPPADRKGS